MPFTTICTYHFEELPSASDTNGLSETRMNTETKKTSVLSAFNGAIKIFLPDKKIGLKILYLNS